MEHLRPIAALPLPDTVRPNAPDITAAPELRWLSPEQLRVDGRYQRDLSERSIRLIHRIVGDFDWRRFKPPIVTPVAGGDAYEVIDGQHSAIAAASHPAVSRIPVLVVAQPDLAGRARAFVGHNRDRVAMLATISDCWPAPSSVN